MRLRVRRHICDRLPLGSWQNKAMHFSGSLFPACKMGRASISAVRLHLKDELLRGTGFLLQGKCALPRATES